MKIDFIKQQPKKVLFLNYMPIQMKAFSGDKCKRVADLSDLINYSTPYNTTNLIIVHYYIILLEFKIQLDK